MFLFKPFRTQENLSANASAPVIIDVNKIGVLDQTTKPEAIDKTPQSNDGRRGLFGMFSFSNSKSTDGSLNRKAVGSSGPALDKVITMKDDLDFVDIQVRKLSYAEAAALNPKQKVQFRSGRSAKGSVDNTREPLVVNDSELGASITDVELLEHQTRNSKYKISYQDLLDQQAESIVNEEVACHDFEPAIYEADETELNYNLKKLVPKKKLRKMKKLQKK